MSAQERSDLIERRAQMAKAIMDTLLAAMQSECPIGSDSVENVVWAVSELLAVE